MAGKRKDRSATAWAVTWADCDCTSSPPRSAMIRSHAGINEAIPAGKCAGQFFDHSGIRLMDERYTVGSSRP